MSLLDGDVVFGAVQVTGGRSGTLLGCLEKEPTVQTLFSIRVEICSGHRTLRTGFQRKAPPDGDHLAGLSLDSNCAAENGAGSMIPTIPKQ